MTARAKSHSKPEVIKTVTSGKVEATYSIRNSRRIRGVGLKLPNYIQQDDYSCGFLAALTVTHYFYPDVPDTDVLSAIWPKDYRDVDSQRMIDALENLGITVEYRDDLTTNHLRNYVRDGTPVIISVWPDEWETDHWTVVQAFTLERFYLTNHPSLTLKPFRNQWINNWGDGAKKGAGLVCTPREQLT